MKIDVNAIRANHDQSFTTAAGEFLVVQRNIGYASNDGKWIVSLLPDLYWDAYGYLRKRKEEKMLGIFATVEDAEAAIASAEPMPELERHELLSR